MEFKPHPYQLAAMDYIRARPAAGLFLDMGLGKTVITLTEVERWLYDSCEVSKVLVIAPLRVAEDTWSRESAKWDHLQHLRISRVLGSRQDREAALGVDADVYCVNRENVPWLVEHYGVKWWPFDCVVIDELSSFKSATSKRFRALRQVRPKVKRLVGLTGTPAPNGLIDLWPQIYLLDMGQRLGKSLGRYRADFFTPAYGSGYITYKWNLRPGSEAAIYDKIRDLCLSMQARDLLQLPDRIDVMREVQLPEPARKAYLALETEQLADLGNEQVITAAQAAAVANKLLQVCNGAVYDEDKVVHELHTAKLDALEDIVEAANGRPVLVFYSYKHDLDRIRARLPQAEVLQGSDTIARWNAGEIPVLLAHPAGAGHGLNLQDGGNAIVWFGLPWSLELYQQANARIYRQGVKGTVTITHIIASCTLDERVVRVLTDKAGRQQGLIDALKGG